MGRRNVEDEPRLLKLPGAGVLEVYAVANGWEDPGVCSPVDDAYPPEEDLEFNVIRVELVFEGARIDLTDEYESGRNQDLCDLVEDITASYS